MTDNDRLIQLHANKSKHSNYQLLPRILTSYIEQSSLETSSRNETSRLAYILKHLDPKGRDILDIGANTGYFSFELIDEGASNATCVEGNPEHAEFIELASRVCGFQDKISVINKYFEFKGEVDRYDIALLLNVLHHVGDDYGDSKLDIQDAKKAIIDNLNFMSGYAERLVFQLGFNSRGDINRPLFANGTKREMIDFIKDGVNGFWEIERVGVAELYGNSTEYKDLNDNNIERDDSLGEFLNRPLFILKSLKYEKE